MKKKILVIFMLVMLTGCDKTKVVNSNTNDNTTSDNLSSKICNKDYDKASEGLVTKLSKLNNFICDNLLKYLSYIDNNKQANYDDVIYLVNLGIDKTYSSYLMNLVKAKFFIVNNLDKYLSNKKDNVDETISYVNAGLYRDYYKDMIETDTSKDTLILVNKYNYLGSTYVPNDLQTIDANFSKGVNNKLRRVAKVAFEKMAAAAKLDGIIIYNLSAYRSYQSQESIYNRSVKNYGVEESDKTSARPGNSEHQTGLALDINSVDNNFENTTAYKWLINNSYKYGFILRYPENKENITGYSFEPWHYRYVGEDVANKIQEEDITFDEYYAYYLNN